MRAICGSLMFSKITPGPFLIPNMTVQSQAFAQFRDDFVTKAGPVTRLSQQISTVTSMFVMMGFEFMRDV